MPNDAGHAQQTAYELRAGPYRAGELRVLSFEGREELNGLYWFDVVVWGQGVDESQLEANVLGRPASLLMRLSGGGLRHVRGIVCGLVLEGRREGGRHAYRLTLVPRLWLLGKRVNSRIIQDKTVQQIANAIFDEHGIARDWHLVGKYPIRQYCVQYQETDYHFIARILAEEGFLFFFDQPASPDDGAEITERLVMVDSAHSYPAIAGELGLVYQPQLGDDAWRAEEHHILDFRACTRIEPDAVALRDYDFQRPRLEPSGRANAAAGAPGIDGHMRALEIYDHHGEYEEIDATSGKASAYLARLSRERYPWRLLAAHPAAIFMRFHLQPSLGIC